MKRGVTVATKRGATLAFKSKINVKCAWLKVRILFFDSLVTYFKGPTAGKSKSILHPISSYTSPTESEPIKLGLSLRKAEMLVPKAIKTGAKRSNWLQKYNRRPSINKTSDIIKIPTGRSHSANRISIKSESGYTTLFGSVESCGTGDLMSTLSLHSDDCKEIKGKYFIT